MKKDHLRNFIIICIIFILLTQGEEKNNQAVQFIITLITWYLITNIITIFFYHISLNSKIIASLKKILLKYVFQKHFFFTPIHFVKYFVIPCFYKDLEHGSPVAHSCHFII